MCLKQLIEHTPSLCIEKGLQWKLYEVATKFSKFLYGVNLRPQVRGAVRSIGGRLMMGKYPAI